jgi:hypothetical protein
MRRVDGHLQLLGRLLARITSSNLKKFRFFANAPRHHYSASYGTEVRIRQRECQGNENRDSPTKPDPRQALRIVGQMLIFKR